MVTQDEWLKGWTLGMENDLNYVRIIPLIVNFKKLSNKLQKLIKNLISSLMIR